MMSNKTKLVLALENARMHIGEDDSSILLEKNTSNNIKSRSNSKSRLNRLLGRKTVADNRKGTLIGRVGVRNKPTYDLIADGVLGKESEDYRPKLDMNNSKSEISSLVAERLKNLRERTLSKISSDTSIAESSFFGFESDGTPIWSSVVSGNRRMDEGKIGKAPTEVSDIHHHSIHIPVELDWPKKLKISNHNTFKTWYPVSENKRVTQLSEQVVNAPQSSLNPLVIVGGSQAGKSHLLHAIGQALLLRSEGDVYLLRGDELSNVKTLENNWRDAFTNCTMLLIDDVDVALNDEELANKVGQFIDYALNLNVHIVVTTSESPETWPASKLWEVMRGGVRTIINPPGAGSLMLYARQLSMLKNLVLDDSQLAVIVTDGDPSWRATLNGIGKIENAVDNGIQILDSVDVYNVLNDIQSDDEELRTERQSESVENIANRLISTVVDVVYSDKDLGGIEITSEIPELSEEYNPPEFDAESFLQNDRDFVEAQIQNTLDRLTPEAPSVIDVDDSDKHLVAKMNRIVEKDHSRAADILTELDVGIDAKFNESDAVLREDTDELFELERMLLNLADRTSDASLEGLIGIADELRDLEHKLVSLDSSRAPLPEFIEAPDIADSLESFTPSGEWNIDVENVSADDMFDSGETHVFPIGHVLEPHPEGVIKTATITPVNVMLSGEEE